MLTIEVYIEVYTLVVTTTTIVDHTRYTIAYYNTIVL